MSGVRPRSVREGARGCAPAVAVAAAGGTVFTGAGVNVGRGGGEPLGLGVGDGRGLMSRFLGVSQCANVMRALEPSSHVWTCCSEPLPNVCSPTSLARA